MENMLNEEGNTGETFTEVNYTCGIDLTDAFYTPSQAEV
jgi:hypothetical protein